MILNTVHNLKSVLRTPNSCIISTLEGEEGMQKKKIALRWIIKQTINTNYKGKLQRHSFTKCNIVVD